MKIKINKNIKYITYIFIIISSLWDIYMPKYLHNISYLILITLIFIINFSDRISLLKRSFITPTLGGLCFIVIMVPTGWLLNSLCTYLYMIINTQNDSFNDVLILSSKFLLLAITIIYLLIVFILLLKSIDVKVNTKIAFKIFLKYFLISVVIYVIVCILLQPLINYFLNSNYMILLKLLNILLYICKYVVLMLLFKSVIKEAIYIK